MRTLVVVAVDEAIEALLLLQEVFGRVLGGFLFEREVHALVTAVLLRMSGLDALDLDAKAQPPDRQSAEAQQGAGASEGHAIVGANGAGQEIERALGRLRDRSCSTEVPPEVVAFVAEKGYDPAYGARHVHRSIERHLLQTLVDHPPGQLRARVIGSEVEWVAQERDASES